MNHFPCFGETVPKLTSNFLAPNLPFLVSFLLTKAVPGSAQLLAATSLCAPKPPAQGPSGCCSTALAVPGMGQLQPLQDGGWAGPSCRTQPQQREHHLR